MKLVKRIKEGDIGEEAVLSWMFQRYLVKDPQGKIEPFKAYMLRVGINFYFAMVRVDFFYPLHKKGRSS